MPLLIAKAYPLLKWVRMEEREEKDIYGEKSGQFKEEKPSSLLLILFQWREIGCGVREGRKVKKSGGKGKD